MRAERALQAKRPLPAEQLEKFVRDTKHSGPGRRLAYEWLVRVDTRAPERLLPSMLNDPSTELRRWFHADERDFDEFARRYAAELGTNPAVDELREIDARETVVTLLYGAKAPADRNHAALLAAHLGRHPKTTRTIRHVPSPES